MKNKLLLLLFQFVEGIGYIIVFILGIIGFIYYAIVCIKDIVVDIIDIIHNFNSFSLIAISISLIFLALLFYIAFNWERRDDFFLFIASILSSPSDYVYKARKKQLIKYRDEIAELINSINYFSDIDETISADDFWIFVDSVSRQKERDTNFYSGLWDNHIILLN